MLVVSEITLLQSCADVSEDADELERRSGGFSSQCSLDSCLSINRMVGSSRSVPLMDEVREILFKCTLSA